MQKKIDCLEKTIAFGLILCIVILMCISTLFAFAKTEHHCDGDECKACEQIYHCLDFLRKLSEGLTVLAAAIPLLGITFLLIIAAGKAINPGGRTLVQLKVRLNN